MVLAPRLQCRPALRSSVQRCETEVRPRLDQFANGITNWPAYDASLRQRGSLTVWFTDEAITAWAAEPRTTRSGQPWYSELAILTALTFRAVFCLEPV